MQLLMEVVLSLKSGKSNSSMIEKKSLILENAVIVGVINGRQNENQSREYMDCLLYTSPSPRDR